jgi:6-pyruvoyltetrahydropterin/6-carboxytetrahydropterin synthase
MTEFEITPVFEITKAATFDAAHHFPNEPEGSI